MATERQFLNPVADSVWGKQERQAPALETVAGKTVGFLSTFWPTYEPFVEELGRMLREKLHVGATPRLDYWRRPRLSEIWGQQKDWIQKLDAAVVGLGAWGGCNAWSLQATAEFQKKGTPAVCIVTENWRGSAYTLAHNLGLAPERVMALPADFDLWNSEQARSCAKDVLDEVVRRLAFKGQGTVQTLGAEAIVEAPEDPDGLQALFLHKGWTDGLPVVVPTEQRVRHVLSTSGRQPQEIVAVLAPLWRAATIEKLAVNAVMAGCRPEYFPVVIAAVEAMADPAFDLLAHATCTSSTTPLVIVNGPIRKAIGMTSGYSVFGAPTHANATIGRALRLIRQNIGGQIPAVTDMSTFGHPGAFSLCIAEDEEHSPWEPLHVQRGFRREDSTVTVAGVLTFQNMCHQRTKELDSLLTVIASGIAQMGYRDFQADPRDVGYVLVMIAPAYALRFAAAGYSLRDLQLALLTRARLPLEEFPQELRPHLERGGRIEGRYVYTAARPEQLIILVAGGFNGSHIGTEPAIVMHTNHQDWKIVSKKIPFGP